MEPTPAIRYLLKYKSSGKALDLGSGEGRNSIFIAKNGFDVTAVDISKEAIKGLEKHAKKEKVKIKTFLEDIRNFKFNKKYDVIFSTAVLHFLREDEAKKIVKKIKVNTLKNGLNLITAFTEENPNKGFPYLFKKGELKSYYKDWEIISYKEFMTPLEKHGKDGKWHKHGMAAIIARKN